ncbi:SDR family oxidoreductase [Streptomyces afghaniensis]|uniref:SDR family oxidoreductase n=1 Tax=Streptomyces afghaniensis TaxID=66865 RepID=UPI0027D8DFEB|nr:SDR family oxidoreductase [Streptomyces afghaniensis]
MINRHARGCSAGLASYRADAQARTEEVGRCVPRGWRGRAAVPASSAAAAPADAWTDPHCSAGLLGLSRALALGVVRRHRERRGPRPCCDRLQLEFEAAAAAAGPIGRSATPDEIAACVMFLAHESASFVTGSTLVADGGHGLPETRPRPWVSCSFSELSPG